jgi:hypothetical protein
MINSSVHFREIQVSRVINFYYINRNLAQFYVRIFEIDVFECAQVLVVNSADNGFLVNLFSPFFPASKKGVIF